MGLAITKGMSESPASYTVAIINAASIFDRVIPGILSDKFGCIKSLIGATIATSIIIFCWSEAETSASILVVAAVFGFCPGAIISGGSVTITLYRRFQGYRDVRGCWHGSCFFLCLVWTSCERCHD